MDEVDSEALADVAYGIFDHLLTRRLQTQGKYLSALVEGGIDFTADLTETFGKLTEEYPQLAESLLARFSSVDTIYRMLCGGKGFFPQRRRRCTGSCRMHRAAHPRQSRTSMPGSG